MNWSSFACGALALLLVEVVALAIYWASLLKGLR